MILFVPVTRFRVTYSLAQGLPYSPLDRLLLEAIGTGLKTLDKLIDCFQLHPRLLVQSLVTLAQTGWIALGNSPEEQFVLTHSGDQALTKNDLPPFREITSRNAYILMDCVTGTVVLENQVQYIRKWDLKKENLWDRSICLETKVYRNTLDASDVYHLLPRQQGQRLHFVGPIELVSKSSEFLVTDVDPDQGTILNLPPPLKIKLKHDLIAKAKGLKNYQKQYEDITRFIKRKDGYIDDNLNQRDCIVEWSQESLLTTAEQHNELLSKVFEQADSVIYIASSAMDVQTLEKQKEGILDALKRGVEINILCGYLSTPESLDWIKKVEYDANRLNLPGKLNFNKELAKSNVRMMLWNEGGIFNGVIGSHDWLSSSTQEGEPLGIKISQPRMFEALARCASSLWRTSKSEYLSNVPDCWDNIATNVVQQAPNISTNDEEKIDLTEMTKMRIILNYEVPALLKEWGREPPQVHLFLVSERLDKEDIDYYLSLVESGNQNRDNRYLTLYGQSDLSEQEISALPSDASTKLGIRKGNSYITGNVVLRDTSACISSLSFLPPPPGEELISQVAIVIEGSKPANQIAEYILRLANIKTNI
ncbi:MAG: hypothetical protein HPY50_04215 [Firmicutes bacterium]|nr:hypothetical protein [Bacillota bacterium]